MPEYPLHQISPTENLTIPVGSAPDRGGSAPPRPLHMSQLVEILTQMKGDLQNQMDWNTQAMKGDIQTLRGEMQNVGRDLLTSWKAGLAEVKGEMENMGRDFTNGTSTLRGEVTKSRGSVEAVWTAMTMGKVEVTSDATIVASETRKLGQVETKSQELGIINEVKVELYEIKEEHTHRTGRGHWG